MGNLFNAARRHRKYRIGIKTTRLRGEISAIKEVLDMATSVKGGLIEAYVRKQGEVAVLMEKYQ